VTNARGSGLVRWPRSPAATALPTIDLNAAAAVEPVCCQPEPRSRLVAARGSVADATASASHTETAIWQWMHAPAVSRTEN